MSERPNTMSFISCSVVASYGVSQKWGTKGRGSCSKIFKDNMQAWFSLWMSLAWMFLTLTLLFPHCTPVQNQLLPPYWPYSGLQSPSKVSPWGAVDQVSAFLSSSLSQLSWTCFRKLMFCSLDQLAANYWNWSSLLRYLGSPACPERHPPSTATTPRILFYR